MKKIYKFVSKGLLISMIALDVFSGQSVKAATFDNTNITEGTIKSTTTNGQTVKSMNVTYYYTPSEVDSNYIDSPSANKAIEKLNPNKTVQVTNYVGSDGKTYSGTVNLSTAIFDVNRDPNYRHQKPVTETVPIGFVFNSKYLRDNPGYLISDTLPGSINVDRDIAKMKKVNGDYTTIKYVNELGNTINSYELDSNSDQYLLCKDDLNQYDSNVKNSPNGSGKWGVFDNLNYYRFNGSKINGTYQMVNQEGTGLYYSMIGRSTADDLDPNGNFVKDTKLGFTNDQYDASWKKGNEKYRNITGVTFSYDYNNTVYSTQAEAAAVAATVKTQKPILNPCRIVDTGTPSISLNFGNGCYPVASRTMAYRDLQVYYPDLFNKALTGQRYKFETSPEVNPLNVSYYGVVKDPVKGGYVIRFIEKADIGYQTISENYTYSGTIYSYRPTFVYTGTLSTAPSTDPTPPPPSDLKAPVAHISAPEEVHTGTPVYVTGYGTDPQGLAITDYEWTSSTGESISGTGGTINITGDSATVTLRVKNEKDMWSDTVTAIIGAVNHPPTVYLQAPNTVVMGNDVAVNAYGSDPDGDRLNYTWNTPSDFNGSCSGISGMGYFDSLGLKNFGVTATDPFGASGSSSAVVNVIAPTPNIIITKTGAEKENRKLTLDATKYSTSGSKRYSIDWTKTVWKFYDVNENELEVDNSPTSSTLIKSLDSTTGVGSMDLIIKKAGVYKATCTAWNTAGYSDTFDILLNITPDIVPVADFNLPKTDVRDIKDPSPHGLAQATKILSDSSSSTDGDVIAKRMWIATFDSDNDGSYIWITKNEDGTTKSTPTYERWYIYDLNYNGDTDTQKGDTTDPNQPNVNDSINPHWRYVGNYYDAKNFNIDTVNCGNLTSVQFKSTSVGQFDFEEVVKEDFGQETIPQLITDKDKKQASSWEIIN